MDLLVLDLPYLHQHRWTSRYWVSTSWQDAKNIIKEGVQPSRFPPPIIPKVWVTLLMGLDSTVFVFLWPYHRMHHVSGPGYGIISWESLLTSSSDVWSLQEEGNLELDLFMVKLRNFTCNHNLWLSEICLQTNKLLLQNFLFFRVRLEVLYQIRWFEHFFLEVNLRGMLNLMFGDVGNDIMDPVAERLNLFDGQGVLLCTRIALKPFE